MTTRVTSNFRHLVVEDARQIHSNQHSTIHTYPKTLIYGQCKQTDWIARIPPAPMLHDRKLQQKQLRTAVNHNKDDTQ